MLVDIHSHQIISEPNIKKLFNLDITEDILNFDLERFFGNNISVSVGIHPWSVIENAEQLDFLEAIVSDSRVKAIGEVGLDKLKGPGLKLQEDVFLKQIRLAERVRKPIIVHCVRSFNELIGIKKIIKPKVPMVIHGFSKKTELAAELLKKGFFLSFGKALIDSDLVKEAFKLCPLEQVFFETDNAKDIEITQVYEVASKLLNVSMANLEEKMYQNYLELYL
jgi:TatD DNase family protein